VKIGLKHHREREMKTREGKIGSASLGGGNGSNLPQGRGLPFGKKKGIVPKKKSTPQGKEKKKAGGVIDSGPGKTS